MVVASNLTETTSDLPPVFANVPAKLKDFAARTMNVLEATAKVSIASLKGINLKDIKKRTFTGNPLNLDKVEVNNSIPAALNWVVKILKNVLEKLDEQGDIIRVHTEVLANPEAAMDVSKKEVEALKKDNETLRAEIDETRQRGIKGNIIVSCPVRNGETLAKHRSEKVNGIVKKETDTELVIRLIREKTKVSIPMEDVVACHPLGHRDKHNFIIRISNRKPGSAWDGVVAAMMKASNMDKTVNAFLNFQLTEKRAA